MPLNFVSDAFQNGQPIPARFTCDGQNTSPPLAWAGVPEAARAFALITDDPDAPKGVFTHWVLFNLPADLRGLSEAIPQTEQLPDGSMQGRNDFGQIGYGGPCPPEGSTHRYRLVLYALDAPLRLAPGASKADLLEAMQGHILAQAELAATYHRQQRQRLAG